MRREERGRTTRYNAIISSIDSAIGRERRRKSSGRDASPTNPAVTRVQGSSGRRVGVITSGTKIYELILYLVYLVYFI